MSAYSISHIKKELQVLDSEQLQQVILRLGKYKVENKELLSYLLFKAHDEAIFIDEVKEGIDESLSTLNDTNLYWAKKTIRKALRFANKNIRYSGLKETEVEIRIYFCQQMKATGLPFQRSTALDNLYNGQLKKIEKVLSTLHEDLQFDYQQQIEELRIAG
ncbi:MULTISPECIES: hypothetical protein [unclassified Imperialibacter]|uniref:hypothetical protein n=1 Tax=unclassified Imperialibacter TaxID=2629706 RepID=UPI0012575ABA|nr:MULTISPECIES: hypothetical protein [unclassified Imperialibacter]CAD5256668.1 conserved hypothetical protein [Imperialibacter sp. 89]CAD5271659.1 conserved hypothetical protein [Imperialibacter sp. 75]VVT19241.1 conserved hypothetical protein [Imperialibacter sp. EC-SDR9]